MPGLVAMLDDVHDAMPPDEEAPESERLEDIEDTEDAALDEAFRAVKQDDVASYKRSMRIFIDACYDRLKIEEKQKDDDKEY